MDQSIEVLVSNPVYMSVAVVLAIVILLGVIKKLFKLVLIVSAILVLWVAYGITFMDWSVEDVKAGMETAIEKTEESLKNVMPKKEEK
tara:strand:- start:93 stop:356 length:264 start_codon:yes stop_codon:yes gene_type:complete